jgi:hypothetical protein
VSHFAKIDKNNIVTEVLVGDDKMPNEGYDFIVETFGGMWVKTSFNTHEGVHSKGGTPLRKNYAGIGYTYDSERDAFIPSKPFESWVLNEKTCVWNAPKPYPSDNKVYSWNEENQKWVEISY